MSAVYDNWERLVDVALRREHDREIAFCSSPSDSDSSASVIGSSRSGMLLLNEQHGHRSDSYGPSYRRKLLEFRSARSRSSEDFKRLTMDFSDLTLHRDNWKEMLDPGERRLLWPSSFISFFIDDRTGKNCFLLGAAKAGVEFGTDSEWELDSRSILTAVVPPTVRIDIRCIVNAEIFSAPTLYAAYLVFERGTCAGLDINSVIVRSSRPPVTTVPTEKASTMRDDEWMELGIGRFRIDETDHDTIALRVEETSESRRVEDISIQGIEFRPYKEKRSGKLDKGMFSRLREKMDYGNTRMR